MTEVYGDLIDFIEVLQSKGITPILFSTPTFGKYNTFISTQLKSDLQLVKDFIVKKYNIEIWDYAFKNTFVKEDFYNCDHLNKKGALKFSEILNQNLNRLRSQ
jgi:hypothetical protein